MVQKNLKHPDEIILSGGHFATIAFLGKIQSLIENESFEINKIKHWICTSGGCLISLLLSIGYKPIELKDILKQIDFEKLSPINSDMMLNFFDNLGLHDTSSITNIVAIFLEHKLIPRNITFEGLKKLTGIKLTFLTFCLNSCQLVELNEDNYGSLMVIDGLQMSISAPFIFKPISYQNRLYTDAVVVSNCPVLKSKSKNTYVFKLSKNDTYYNKINIFTLIKIIFRTLVQQIENHEIRQTNHRVFCLNSNFEFDNELIIKSEKIEQIFKSGYNDLT